MQRGGNVNRAGLRPQAQEPIGIGCPMGDDLGNRSFSHCATREPGIRIVLVFILAAALQLPDGRTDAANAACPVSDAVIAGLMKWIEDNTGYDTAKTAADMPSIETCASGAIIEYAHEDTMVDEGIRGLYDFEARRIYLVEPWDPDDSSDLGVLLHELIHAVQLDNREWECVGAPEWEAYTLHEAWLAERGLSGNFDWLQVYFNSRCPRDIHP